MTKYPIKLGRSMGGPDGPSMPTEIKKGEKFYPSVYLDWGDKYDLPDSGTMTIKFRKVSETTSSRPGDKERQSVTLDILEIVDTKAGKEEKKEESGEEALDRHMNEAKKEKDSEEDYE